MGFNSAFKGLRNTGIINSTTRLHLVGSFYEIYRHDVFVISSVPPTWLDH